MQKRENDRLLGVWKHSVGGWEIKYQQGGKKFSEYRKDETEARLRGDYWKATLESPQEQDDSYEHPVIYWERKLRQITELMLAEPHNKELSATCRAMASAATAAMRTAKYIPAPRQVASPDSAPITGDVTNLTTEQMEELLGANKT